MHPGVLVFTLEQWVDPAAAFSALFAESTRAFWLDSGVHATTGRSFMGEGSRVVSGGGEVLDVVASELTSRRIPDSGGLPLGWIGWLGYELRGTTMVVPDVPESRYPDAAMLEVDRALVFDHAENTVQLVALGDHWTSDLIEWRTATVGALSHASAPRPATRPLDATATWRYSDAEYIAMIESCQRSISAGDAYQLCLTTEAVVDVTPDPFATYLALRASSPSHHGALLRIGEVSLLSASPEQFLAVSPGGVIESKPIKGTRSRGTTPERDAELRAELLASDKERAENLMIVDLMRNDITRVAEIGSVTVPSLFAVESYAHVHQLVSTVRGQLAENQEPMDAVRACFPAGSMTGAPKRSATLLIDALEHRARGIYSGAFGLFALDGTIDLAMVIRSIILDPTGATVGAGGGITALSVPQEELEEVHVKAAALLRVLGA
ncbi:MAG: aminodeoxychorismate synthase component I [Microbacteriaceae bacterium]